MTGHDEILTLVVKSPPIAAKLAHLGSGETSIRFSHVIESAQPFLVAAIRQHVRQTIWVVASNVRAQELFYESLLNWVPQAAFLPEAEFAAVENILPDPEIAAERLDLLTQLEKGNAPGVIVTTRLALDQAAPKSGSLKSAALELRRGQATEMEQLLSALSQAGYERTTQVVTRGQFAVRGGIVDIFSWQASLPVRVEFFADEIDSIREFDLDTQTSVRTLDCITVLLSSSSEASGRVRDYVKEHHLTLELQPEEDSTADVQIAEGWIEQGPEDFETAFQESDVGELGVGDFMLVEAKRAQFVSRLEKWRDQKARLAIYFQTEGEIERFREIVSPEALAGVALIEGTLSRGFSFPAANLVVLSANELIGRFPVHGRRRLQRAERRNRAQIDFSELSEGDLVVHLEHGIGRFLQLTEMPTGGGTNQEVLALEFAEEAKLYVPLEQAYLVSRYVGVGKKSPPLSSLADTKWTRAKRNAAVSIFDYAGKMLALQAARQTNPGHAFAPDTKWQAEFEHSFPYRETPDQFKAIIEPQSDMERPRPMDRLICGDVGFGKTEVAIRAAFKAVIDGKQVAVLAPTTVLAQQHFETFRQRMLDYPVRIEMLSRFRSQAEQKKILQLLREGGVEIVIGTHRLISGDVVFKDLGLVVIDEEQRFGVLHKEKFKELFKLVHVLTLSATPIPRTLYLSLVGVKDMSTIETPPLNRLPVETVVCGY